MPAHYYEAESEWDHLPSVPVFVLYGHKLHDLGQDEEVLYDNIPQTHPNVFKFSKILYDNYLEVRQTQIACSTL